MSFKTVTEKIVNIKLVAVRFRFVFITKSIAGVTSPSTYNFLFLESFIIGKKYKEIT